MSQQPNTNIDIEHHSTLGLFMLESPKYQIHIELEGMCYSHTEMALLPFSWTTLRGKNCQCPIAVVWHNSLVKMRKKSPWLRKYFE